MLHTETVLSCTLYLSPSSRQKIFKQLMVYFNHGLQFIDLKALLVKFIGEKLQQTSILFIKHNCKQTKLNKPRTIPKVWQENIEKKMIALSELMLGQIHNYKLNVMARVNKKMKCGLDVIYTHIKAWENKFVK